jgi:hypothetical protein
MLSKPGGLKFKLRLTLFPAINSIRKKPSEYVRADVLQPTVAVASYGQAPRHAGRCTLFFNWYDYLSNQFMFIYSAIGTTRVRYRYVLAVRNGFGTNCMGRSSGWTTSTGAVLHSSKYSRKEPFPLRPSVFPAVG